MSYTEAVIRCGGIPVILPYSTHKEELLEALALCDGVIIPGGVDVDASYFDEVPHPACGEVDPILDDIEFSALKYLEEHRVPALGICRGAQVMNIYAGGTIYQDLASQYPAAHQHRQKQDRIYPSHEVIIEKETRLHDILDCESIRVNSIHHQAVKEPGNGFVVSARSADGVVEAIEHQNGIWFAVQWHPEDLFDTVPQMKGIFEEIIEKARLDGKVS